MEDRKHNNAEWCIEQIEEQFEIWMKEINEKALAQGYELGISDGMYKVVKKMKEILYD